MTTEIDTERVARIRRTGLIRDATDLDAWVRSAPDYDEEASVAALRKLVDAAKECEA